MGCLFCKKPNKIFPFELCYCGKVLSPLQSTVPRNQGVVPIFFLSFGSFLCTDVIAVQAEEKMQPLSVLRLQSQMPCLLGGVWGEVNRENGHCKELGDVKMTTDLGLYGQTTWSASLSRQIISRFRVRMLVFPHAWFVPLKKGRGRKPSGNSLNMVVHAVTGKWVSYCYHL